MSPTKREVIQHIREHYGLSFQDVTSILNSPTHPAGMRDEFAARAVQGLLASPVQPQSGPDMYARDAYKIADAMLQERVKHDTISNR
jgi:hypothetical protein